MLKRKDSKKILSKQTSQHNLLLAKTPFGSSSINLINIDRQKSHRKLFLDSHSHQTSQFSSKGPSRSKDITMRLDTNHSEKDCKLTKRSKSKSLK